MHTRKHCIITISIIDLWNTSVADPRFSGRGGANPWFLNKNLFLVRVLPKTPWNWKKLDQERGGGRVWRVPSPSWIRQCTYYFFMFNIEQTIRCDYQRKQISCNGKWEWKTHHFHSVNFAYRNPRSVPIFTAKSAMPLHLTWHVSVLLTTIFMPQQNEVNFGFREGMVSLPSFSEKDMRTNIHGHSRRNACSQITMPWHNVKMEDVRNCGEYWHTIRFRF